MSYKNYKEYREAYRKWGAQQPSPPTCSFGDTELAFIDTAGELCICGELTLTVEETRVLVKFLNEMYGEEDERSSKAV